VASFDPLWGAPAEAFAPTHYGEDPTSPQGFEAVGEPAPLPPPEQDPRDAGPEAAAEEPALEPPAYDPAEDGWIRVEDHQAALQAARDETETETREDLADELGEQTEQLKALVEELEQRVAERQWLRQEIIADAAEDVATLVLALSRRVAGETLAVHPRALQHLVHQAMAALPGDDGVRVRVRPEDLPILEHHVDSRRPITWVPDPELRQGVVVQTDLGQVEASLDCAFEALQVAVSDWLEQQRS